MTVGIRCVATILSIYATTNPLRGEEAPAAVVDGVPISSAEIRKNVAKKLDARNPDARAEAMLFAEFLDAAINGQVLENMLAKSPQRATEAEIDAALAGLLTQLRARNPRLTLEILAASGGQSVADMRRVLGGKLSLNKYLSATLTPALVEDYFERNRAQFDGTELRVKHLVLRPLRTGNPEELSALLAQAVAIRQDILSGKTTFDEAVRKYSLGPSRERGGDLGFIRRDGPLYETFNQAAFALEKNDGSEISQPILTPSGVHLTTRTDAKPGRKTLNDVTERVRAALIESEARRLVVQLRREAKVAISPDVPHWKPGTRELVLPSTVKP